MDLEEYYLTGCEMEILRTHSKAIVENHLGDVSDSEIINVIELGAGDGRKTRVFLTALVIAGVKFEYIPIDISYRAMTLLGKSLEHHFERDALSVHGIVAEYIEGIQFVVDSRPRKSLVLFLGSSLGNFSKSGGVAFLREIGSTLKQGDLFMIGTDLKKNPEMTLRAYSDSLGVTRKFNLNLLSRMNRELGTTFDLKKFKHYASYDPMDGTAVSYLISTEKQTVYMNTSGATGNGDEPERHEFVFEAYEAIHTESSRKYTVESMHSALNSIGFAVQETYYDSQHWFADTVAKVV